MSGLPNAVSVANALPIRFAQATLVVAALALAACGKSVADPTATTTDVAELRVCFAENDPPRSRRGARGIDVDVATHLARRLDRRLMVVWLPDQAQTDIESTDADYRPLAMGQCDLQLSVPGTPALHRLAGRLILTEPYYGAGFELIPRDSPFRFGTPFAGTVAVRANTVAHLALDAARVEWSQQVSSAAVVAAVADDAAAAGLVWGPDLTRLDAEYNRGFEAPPVLRWNLHAALRRDSPILDDVQRVFASAEFREQVAALLARHGMPVREPFDNVHTSDLLGSL